MTVPSTAAPNVASSSSLSPLVPVPRSVVCPVIRTRSTGSVPERESCMEFAARQEREATEWSVRDEVEVHTLPSSSRSYGVR